VLVWLNGKVLAARHARVPALDRGLLHGDGVYDTWRTYGGRPFALAAHLARLARACRLLGLPPVDPAAVWASRATRLVHRNGLDDATVRLTITRGDAGDAVVPTRRARPTTLLTVRTLPPDLARQQADGIAAVLLPFPRDVQPPWSGVKLLGHASAVLGRLQAARARAQEALYVTAGGEVTEGTTSNLLVVERGRLVTPPLDAGVLGGVTRDLVLRLARRAGIEVREARVRADRLAAADEVLVTASTIEILPVVRLDGRPIATGEPGPVARALLERYHAEVARWLRRPRRP
jgi:branched-subunit amino acid aminotransferase/4-amino-4-deoxychorismate lyase